MSYVFDPPRALALSICLLGATLAQADATQSWNAVVLVDTTLANIVIIDNIDGQTVIDGSLEDAINQGELDDLTSFVAIEDSSVLRVYQNPGAVLALEKTLGEYHFDPASSIVVLDDISDIARMVDFKNRLLTVDIANLLVNFEKWRIAVVLTDPAKERSFVVDGMQVIIVVEDSLDGIIASGVLDEYTTAVVIDEVERLKVIDMVSSHIVIEDNLEGLSYSEPAVLLDIVIIDNLEGLAVVYDDFGTKAWIDIANESVTY